MQDLTLNTEIKKIQYKKRCNAKCGDFMDIDDIIRNISLVDIVAKDIKLKKKGHEYVGLCPIHNEKSPSFTIFQNSEKDRYHCFGCGASGDVVDYIESTRGLNKKEAIDYLSGETEIGAQKPRKDILIINKYEEIEIIKGDFPLKSGARVYSPNHKKWFNVTFQHAFKYSGNMAVLRIEREDGKITPQVVYAKTPDGEGWCYMAFPEPRPLYGFSDEYQQVIVVQGEKKSDQLRSRFLYKRCVVSASGGDNAIEKTNWDLLTGKDVIVWPDADESGVKAAKHLAQILTEKALRVRLVDTEDMPPKWDCGDMLTDNPQADPLAFIKDRLYTPEKEVIEKQEKPKKKTTEAWQTELILKKSSADSFYPDPKSVHNLLLYLEHHERYAGVFRYNDFSKQIIVARCPPWENDEKFRVRDVDDIDYIRVQSDLEKHAKIKAARDTVANAIQSVAMSEKYAFNPAKEYFMSLEWDGVKRAQTFLRDHVATFTSGFFGSESSEYLDLVGKKFLCGLAARAMYPGCKFDEMLVLEGLQFAGKSRITRKLATINGEEYYTDGLKDINNKDSLMQISGKLIVEFEEISAMRRAEISDLKGFLSRQEDTYRAPYARNPITSPRQCVFIGTVNPDQPYLRDVTSNRRFWPVTCRDKFDFAEIERIIPQLHAEAAHLVKNGEQIYLKKQEQEICAVEQNKRVVGDIWRDQIEAIVRNYNIMAADEILMQLKIDTEKRTPLTQSRLSTTMTLLGWRPDRITIAGTTKTGYRRVGCNENYELSYKENYEEIKF